MKIVKIKTKAKNNKYKINIWNLPEIKLENNKVAIITNPTVSKLYLEEVKKKIKAKELYVIEIPDWEEYKTLDTVNNILNKCFEFKLNRTSKLISLWGWVIWDITWFAASIFNRWIWFIQMPTTLLAQVDASVWGKTWVNNKFWKNLLWTFWQPDAVYIDTNFLKSLPEREISAWMAEVIKMAITFDRKFFDFLLSSNIYLDNNKKLNIKVLNKIIKKSVKLKAKVVSLDERERWIRAVLNYGHTFGHVIENIAWYWNILHGEAVWIWMCLANNLAVKLWFLKKSENIIIKECLKKYNIPINFVIKDKEEFYNKLFLDKKAWNNKIKFILAKWIWNNIIIDNINKKDVISIL